MRHLGAQISLFSQQLPSSHTSKHSNQSFHLYNPPPASKKHRSFKNASAFNRNSSDKRLAREGREPFLAQTPRPGSSYRQEAVCIAHRLQPPGHAVSSTSLVAELQLQCTSQSYVSSSPVSLSSQLAHHSLENFFCCRRPMGKLTASVPVPLFSVLPSKALSPGLSLFPHFYLSATHLLPAILLIPLFHHFPSLFLDGH